MNCIISCIRVHVYHSKLKFSVRTLSSTSFRQMNPLLITKNNIFDDVFFKIIERDEYDGNLKVASGTNAGRLLVFYDGGCPLCAKEIAFYDRLNRKYEMKIGFVNLMSVNAPTAIETNTTNTITEANSDCYISSSKTSTSNGCSETTSTCSSIPTKSSVLTLQKDKEYNIALRKLLSVSGIDIPVAFRRLHVLREDGRVEKNAEAFCEIWERLPYWRVLVPVVTHVPGVLPLANVIYKYFAEKRLKWRHGLPAEMACSLKRP